MLESLPLQSDKARGPAFEAVEGWPRVTANAGAANVRPRPVVVVAPPIAAALTDRQLRAVLAHEVAHLEGHDAWRPRLRGFLMILCAGAAAVSLHGVASLRGMGGLPDRLSAQSLPFLLAVGYLVFRVLFAVGLMAARAEERAADLRMVELSGDPQACIGGQETLQAMLGLPRSWTLPQRLLVATHPARTERLRLLRDAASSMPPTASDPRAGLNP